MSRRNKPSSQTSLMLRLLTTFWQSISGLFQRARRSPASQPKTNQPKIRPTKLRRSLFLGIITFILTISLSGLDLWLPRPAYAAGLYIEPITWDFIGLDSNNVNVGPNNFLLAARVCNTSGATLNDIRVQYVPTGAINPYITVTAINGVNVDTVNITSLPSGPVPLNHQKIADAGAGNMTPANCFDGYFNVVVSRDSNAYRTVQQYKIVASTPSTGSVDTNSALGNGTISGYNYAQTVPQQLYVEKILSQARNEVISFVGPTSVFVGDTVEYVLTTKTATAYPQLTVSSDFPNGILQLVDVKTTYSSDPGAVSSGVYFDGCGWLANPRDPGYNTSANTCEGPVVNQDTTGDGKVGNTVVTRYRVKVLSTGNGLGSNTINVKHLINDFSGGSFHYNADYGAGLGISTITVNDSTTDLQIVKSHTGNFATGNNTYQLAVRNNGPLAARGTLTVVDTLPTGFSFVSATGTNWTCSASGQVVTCTNPNTSNLAVGATSTINLTVNVSASAASYSLNTATVTSGSPDSNLANNSSSDPTTVIKGTNIVLLKDDSVPDPAEQTFVAGSTATYQLIARNTSGFNAVGPLTIIDTLPIGLSYASSSGTGWSCSANGQNVTCTNPSGLNSGDGITTGISTLSITVNVLSSVPTSVTNTASLTSGSLDTNPADNTNIQQTNPTTKPVPDLIVSKTDNGQSFAVAQNGTYTITVTNQGAAATSGIITVTDTLPASFTYVSAASAPGSSGWTCSAPPTKPVVCTNPNPLPINNSTSILLTVAPTTVTGSPFTNSVAVSLPAGEETNTGNNTGSDTTPVVTAGNIDLNVVKKLTLVGGVAPSPACTTSGQTDTCTTTINPGNTIQYQITVTNNSGGSGADTGITLTDVVPPEITGVTWSCTFVGTSPNDLGVGNPSSFNSCTGAATLGTQPYASHQSSGSGNININTISLRKKGGSSAGQVVITVNGTIASSGFSGNFSNSATATPSAASGADSNIADNTYTVNARIQGADLSLAKTSFANFVQGQNGTYRLTVTNTGTPNRSTTNLITVTDVLPTNLTYVSASSASGSSGWSCSYASGTRTVTCTNPNALASGATSAINITVTTALTGTAYNVTNNATVQVEGDLVAGNNTASVTTSVIVPDPDVRITKTAGTLALGQSGTYTLQVDNIGTTTAIAPIVVTDTLPTGLNYVSGTGSGWICSASGQVVTCTSYSNIAPSASAPPLTLNVLVGTQTASSITNNASVAQVSGEPSGKLANNSTSLVSSVTQAADLAVVKSHTDNFIQGQNASYKLLVTNYGPSSVPNLTTVTVTDSLPNNLEFLSSTGGGFTCTAPAKVDGTPQVVTCTNNSGLVVGTSATINLNVLVRGTTSTGTITNTASVSSSVPDPVSSNNSSSDPTTIQTLQADLRLTKTHFGSFVLNGQGTYTLSVENLGPALATGTLTITDVLPSDLTFASSVGSPWTCSATGTNPQTVTCTNTNTSGLASGSTTAVNIKVNIGPATPVGTNSITNPASLNVPAYDPVPSNNNFTDPTTISGSADLSVTKTTASTFKVGQQATYTITVFNSGSSSIAAAAPITITDQLPTGLTYASGSGTNWTCPTAPPDPGPDVECTYSQSIPIGGSSSALTFNVNVNAAIASPFTNSVTAISPTPDPNLDNNTGTVTSSLPPGGLIFVKRITAINGVAQTGFNDDTTSPKAAEDNDAGWPTDKATYLRGAITGVNAKPGDVVEYTTYFLSNGGFNLRDVKFCDLIPANTTFVANGFAAGQGIGLGYSTSSLPNPAATPGTLFTNASGDDAGTFYSAGDGATPTICTTANANNTSNSNGAVFVQIVNAATDMPFSTAPGTPAGSYGFVRFRVTVN